MKTLHAIVIELSLAALLLGCSAKPSTPVIPTSTPHIAPANIMTARSRCS